MNKKLKFKRGDGVKNRRDNIVGIVVGVVFSIYGETQFEVEFPKTENKSYEHETETLIIDESELMLYPEAAKNIDPSYVEEFDTDFKLELGQKVKHLIVKFEGVIVAKRVFANQCKYYNVMLETLSNDNNFVSKVLSENVLELISDETNVTKKLNSTKPATSKKGGPRYKEPQINEELC